MKEKFICSICHKKVNEVIGFMGSKIKYCYKCHSKKLEQNCVFLREYILNSFSMKDQKRFLDEGCNGKSFEEVLNNFKPKEVEQLKKENEVYKIALNDAVETLRLMDGCEYDCNHYLAQAEKELKGGEYE